MPAVTRWRNVGGRSSRVRVSQIDAPMKPRFSLLVLVLLMAVIAMALGLWRQHRRIAPLQSELSSLKYELGVVEVRDPNRMFVNMASRTPDFYRHLVFRVYVPPGKSGTAVLRMTEEKLGQKDQGECTAVLPAGHSLLEMWITRRAVGDAWDYYLRNSETAGSGTDGPLPPWFAENGSPLALRFSRFPPEGLSEGEEVQTIRRSIVRSDGTAVEVSLDIGLDAAKGAATPAVP